MRRVIQIWRDVALLALGMCSVMATYQIDPAYLLPSAFATPYHTSDLSLRENSNTTVKTRREPTPLVVILHDKNLDGVPDEVASPEVKLDGSDSCREDDESCALSFVMMQLPEQAKVVVRAKKKCPTRKIKRVVTSSGTIVRQRISSAAKKRCKKPTRKPKPSATPKPKVTATPVNGEPLPAPSPEPTKGPTPSASATPIRQPTPTPIQSGGGNAALGKSFYSQVCTSCHGVKGGKSEQQVVAAMSSVSEHSSVRGLVSSQTAKDIAAYLATVR